MLNVASTAMYTILALIVNLTWYACTKWTSSLKLVVILAQCRYTKTAQSIFKYSDIQYTVLLWIKLNSLIYRTLLCVNIYGSYKLLRTICFWPTLYIVTFCNPDEAHIRDKQQAIIIILIYKISSESMSLVESVPGRPRLWSASTGCVELPRVLTSTGQRSFSFHGPTVSNSLPSALHDDSLSLNTFSRRLKTYLFGQ